MPHPDRSFVFFCCQVGAEAALKQELAARWPDFRLAFSRPGFVTFKLPSGLTLADDFDLQLVFARCGGFSFGGVQVATGQGLAQQLWQRICGPSFQHLHVWQRDTALPGDHGFEPGETPLAQAAAECLTVAGPPEARQLALNSTAQPGDRVLDCVLVEPNHWWAGWHVARQVPSCWPGGVCPLRLPADAVSRAYLKMREAIEWSRLPLRRGQLAAEIGSAPGGSCQALLDLGLRVVGVDPAEMDPALLERTGFTHLRKRAKETPRREFRDVQWLMADLNVAPNYTLDTVEAIVTHREVHVRGLLLTLKLLEWSLATHVDEYLARIRSWGFHDVRARQLAFNRQEICVAAHR